MNGRFLNAVATCVALLYVGTAAAQSQRTEHTLNLDDPDNPPAAMLADASLLIGSWTGTAFGGTLEEVWNPPSGGSMVGFFKLMHDGDVYAESLERVVESAENCINRRERYAPDLQKLLEPYSR